MTFRKFLLLLNISCLICCTLFTGAVFAEETGSLQLYAKSAVLIDGDTGRVLYEKNGYEQLPMASTTKIMTCILTLEMADLEDVVTVSARASSMPKVRLGMVENEQFRLKDLLYSMMLESHNDSAVAIAEHVAGSVEEFAAMMNQKARDLGCYNTYFVTPNGLDGAITDKDGTIHEHHTTAAELAKILCYCITYSSAKDVFLEITRTGSYTFSNVKGTRTFSCSNHNRFLSMMDGALTGKTGFTAKAGYCYVGALRRGERTFVVALLACGWPNNKNYKWADTKALMEYGLDQFEYREIFQDTPLSPVPVKEGVTEDEVSDGQAKVKIAADYGECAGSIRMLLGKDQQVQIETEIVKEMEAPVEKNAVAGYIRYRLGDEILMEFPVLTAEKVERRNISWSMKQVFRRFLIDQKR